MDPLQNAGGGGEISGLPVAIVQALGKMRVGSVTPESISIDGGRATMKLDAKWPTQMSTFSQAQTTSRQQLHALMLEKAGRSVLAVR